LWDHALARSAGFSAEGPLRLADESLAAAADALVRAVDDPTPAAADGEDRAARFAASWRRHTQERQAEIAAIAADPMFLLALTWQNRKIVDNAIRPFLAQVASGASRSRKLRVREQVIAAYWQRYCLKCESIGFFGPPAWAAVGGHGPTLTTRHGPSLVDYVDVFFESWPLDGLARGFARDHDLGAWLAPRRAPHIRVADGTVFLPDGTHQPIEQVPEAALIAADGQTPAADLAARVARRHPPTTVDQVMATLDDLRRRGWLIWKLEFPPTVRPEAELRALLDRFPSAVRSSALAQLDTLERARDAVADAAMDAQRLAPALAALDDAYVDATGASATRNDGLTYGGRTLAYLECRRDLTVGVGQELVDAMAPLGLVLDSIRWLLHRVGERVQAMVDRTYDDLVRNGTGTPSATALWLACTPMLGGGLTTAVQESLAELQQRWQTLLDIPEGATSATFRTEEIRRAVDEMFAAPATGWTAARWCSPDVMVAADSEDAINEGRFQLVLGEVHAAINTVDYASMVPLHRTPEDLMACLDADHPEPRLMVALPRESRPRLTVRGHPALVRDRDHRLVVSPHVPIPARGRVHLGADVPVERDADGLYLKLPDGSRFGVLELFANPIRGEVAQSFDLHPAGPRPRIVVDRMVLARQRWTLPAADMRFAQQAEEADRFVGCRAWARALGLPRRVFVKSPLETKPFYVDFASPTFVELLVTAARRVVRDGQEGALTLTEMLPDVDETWLADAQGRRYVAELRFVAFDNRRAQEGDRDVRPA
jgi:hypothetical protein